MPWPWRRPAGSPARDPFASAPIPGAWSAPDQRTLSARRCRKVQPMPARILRRTCSPPSARPRFGPFRSRAARAARGSPEPRPQLADLDSAELKWQAELFQHVYGDGFRLARPRAAADGSLCVDGWCATEHMAGRHERRAGQRSSPLVSAFTLPCAASPAQGSWTSGPVPGPWPTASPGARSPQRLHAGHP